MGPEGGGGSGDLEAKGKESKLLEESLGRPLVVEHGTHKEFRLSALNGNLEMMKEIP